ncbi:MAG TPA: RNA polymerase-binding protein RbpA [Candidatus Microbacterium stercoravium]|uniref:RNA polymerase-binding protein RbpA n=1 Tax=Candidatus Microbacterium stercoravium TaxID=2838697 RepID=A0A9D2KID1_9MICO|nr:RNA polymerase-binding protein RbpA [Candidatus Microbacterium stercoravium]
MAGGSASAIRGTRIGSGPMGEQDHGHHAERIDVTYWDAYGNSIVRSYAADVPADEIPEIVDHPKSGLPAGRDKDNPPAPVKLEPYKTHLAYVKERRSDEEGAELLEDALKKLRDKRGQ